MVYLIRSRLDDAGMPYLRPPKWLSAFKSSAAAVSATLIISDVLTNQLALSRQRVNTLETCEKKGPSRYLYTHTICSVAAR
jgi:hypothetical protein